MELQDLEFDWDRKAISKPLVIKTSLHLSYVGKIRPYEWKNIPECLIKAVMTISAEIKNWCKENFLVNSKIDQHNVTYTQKFYQSERDLEKAKEKINIRVNQIDLDIEK